MPTPTPPADWPRVLVPLPVLFTFDPTGALYFSAIEEHGSLDVARQAEHYVGTARQLFSPMLPRLNTATKLNGRTPEALTSLPPWDEVEADVRRWLS